MGHSELPDQPEDDGPPRTTWFSAKGPRPELPYYLRSTKRLRSLDEFEAPAWKGRARLDERRDDEVTLRGVARETARYLAVFLIVAVIAIAAMQWREGKDNCWRVAGEFKVGWC